MAKEKPWRENNCFAKKIVAREVSETTELLTLDCGHRLRMPLPNPSTAIRCRFCIRELTGYNPAGDPTPDKRSLP